MLMVKLLLLKLKIQSLKESVINREFLQFSAIIKSGTAKIKNILKNEKSLNLNRESYFKWLSKQK